MSQSACLARAVRVASLLVFALAASLNAAEPKAGSTKSSAPATNAAKATKKPSVPKADAAKAVAAKADAAKAKTPAKSATGTTVPAAAEQPPKSSRAGESKAVEVKPASSIVEAKPAEAEIGIQVPPGFRVTQYADDSLAHDIFSMTIDASGRVVVSGPGYVKILIDTDGDGKADVAKAFVDNLESGAQGMFFLGKDLLCTAGDGLVRYRDENGDDKADGPPETFLKVKTGGEHNAHAIRRGPDGWWYLITGNTAEITAGYATLPTSPVKQPHGGVVLRLKPDLSGGEVLADGFRNAYDFDFNAQGDLFVYDSDGERDISLPWYLPNRMFHVVPGGFQGWITDSWKQPDDLLDSAPVVAATGRSSPTGVACYRHTQFPEKYRGNLFALDWTFGRVFAIPLDRHGATWKGTPVEFMTAKGQFGFAPTDAEVGPDGSLFVCVGGRGTHGTVYKVTYVGEEGQAPPRPVVPLSSTATPEQQLRACLEAPQPLQSWSRAQWVPLAKKLGAQPFLSAALSDERTPAARLRAIEILTELFGGIPEAAIEILSNARLPEVRARGAWSLGMTPAMAKKPLTMGRYLGDADPLVRRVALESALLNQTDIVPFLPMIARAMDDDQRSVRLAAARLVPQLSTESFKTLSEAARRVSWKAALTNAVGFVWRSQAQEQQFNSYAVDIGRRALDGKFSQELKLDAVRLLQMALGDLGSSDDLPPAFDGFASSMNLGPHERELDPLRISVAQLFPTNQRVLDLELSRLIAMLALDNPEVLSKVLSRLTETSHPVDDLHYLSVAARMPTGPSKQDRATIVKALVGMAEKLATRNLQQDNNWNDRVSELFGQLVDRDDKLPEALISAPEFGRPQHVVFLSRINEKQLPRAVASFAKAINADPNYPWNNDVVFVLGQGKRKEYYDLIRKQFDRFELKMATMLVLAERPQEEDRLKYAAGLDSAAIEVLSACLGALEQLPAARDGTELASLVKLLRRLGADPAEFPLRERVVHLLERNADEKFAFEFGEDGYRPQPEALDKWTAWVGREFPEESAKLLGNVEADITRVKSLLNGVDWNQGDAGRGKKLFTSRSCAQCHSGAGALGPDLAGASTRFSREDLFIAIAIPNRDVSPRYQTTLVETRAGKIYTGLIVYEAVDGLLLRNGTNQTFRIDPSDIESKKTLPTSLMPNGLLNELSASDLADLYAFLRGMNPQTAEGSRDSQKE